VQHELAHRVDHEPDLLIERLAQWRARRMAR
jgi:hypothetical protein